MKSKSNIKILISGGWGYGNLGDDAILVSTVKILRSVFPESEIVIMSYNVEETKVFAGIPGVKYVSSIHRYLVGNTAKRKYGIVKSDANLNDGSKIQSFFNKLGRIPVKVSQYTAAKKFKAAKQSLNILPAYPDFKGVDLYVQAGGGYFNDEWKDKVYSHVLELLVAKEMNIKSLVIGQSIGPFGDPRIREIAIQGLKVAGAISVRDTDSRDELHKEGIMVDLSPDLAISQVDFKIEKKELVSLIIGGYGMSAANVDSLVFTINEYANENAVKVRIMVSRLWATDIRLANRVYRAIQSLGCNVELVIPQSLGELQLLLGESRVLVSQNLHGLILAWRAGVPCVSLNDGRKFVSFMKQTSQEHRLIPLKLLKHENLKAAIDDAFSNSVGFEEQRMRISQQIQLHFIEKLKFLGLV